MACGRRCCAECFGDPHLRRELFPKRSKETGKCDYCGEDDQPLLAPETDDLVTKVRLVVDIYEPDDTGEPLAYWLREDWAMFTHPAMDPDQTGALLRDILDDEAALHQRYSPADTHQSDALERWEELRRELMHRNRYFTNFGFDQEQLTKLLSNLSLDPEAIPAVWYRSRTHAKNVAHTPYEMGAPPAELATHGRANPAGIPYLYLASSPDTAIAELRPHVGEMASVAKFTLCEGLSIIDLATPRQTVSPFVLEDDEEVGSLRWHLGFLEKLEDELKRPVLPNTAAVSYTPSQYLCEFVKSRGHHGVRYASSVGGGYNLALFDPARAMVGSDVTLHRVTRVDVEHAPADG